MGCYRPPYYITAYALAQKRGFKGTLDEWLESLKGSEVELRYENDILQWRHEGEEQWQDLLDLSTIEENKAACAEAAEQAAQDRVEAQEAMALTKAFAKQLSCHVPLTFELGTISGDTGVEGESNVFMRSGFFPIVSDALDIFAPDDFQTRLIFYNQSMEYCGFTSDRAGSYRAVMAEDGRAFARLVVHPDGAEIETVATFAAMVSVFSPPKVKGMPTLVIPVEPDAGAVSDEDFDEMLAAAQRGQPVRLWFKSNDTYYDLQSLHDGSQPWMTFTRVDMGFKITILTVERGLMTIYGSVFCVPHTRTINGKALSLDITLTAEDVGALPADTVLPSGSGVYVGADAPTDPASNVWVDTDEEAEESGALDPEVIAQAVEDYLAENPVEVPEVVLPEKLPSPYALTIGGVSYDGSEAVSVEIPSGGGGAGWKLIGETTTTEAVSLIEIKSETPLDEMLVYFYVPPIDENPGGTSYLKPVLKNQGAIPARIGVTVPNTKFRQEWWYFVQDFVLRQYKDGTSSAGTTVSGVTDEVFSKIRTDRDNGGGVVGFQLYWNNNCTFPAGVILRVWGR